MKEQVAKRYVKALISSLDTSELEKANEDLKKIRLAFSVEKFISIIQSPDLRDTQKVNFVLSLVDDFSPKMINFIKILGKNNRLDIIPIISKELSNQISINKNEYFGELEGNFDLTSEQIQKLEDSFSKKFNVLVKIVDKKTDYPGIKVSLDGLGVEVSFSVQKLKAQMTEHILKAI